MAIRSPDYQAKLTAGQDYEDFIAHRLYDEGIVIVNYHRQGDQYRFGENKLGLEIKFRAPDIPPRWVGVYSFSPESADGQFDRIISD